MEPSVRVRPCEPSDCASIASLGRSVWGDWANGQPLPRQLIELNHPIFIAENFGGELIGYCVGVAEAFGNGGWLLSITIAPDWRRMGLGEQLVNAVLSVFRENDTAWIKTIISEENIASRQLFEKLGFTPEVTIKGYYEAEESIIRYQLQF